MTNLVKRWVDDGGGSEERLIVARQVRLARQRGYSDDVILAAIGRVLAHGWSARSLHFEVAQVHADLERVEHETRLKALGSAKGALRHIGEALQRAGL